MLKQAVLGGVQAIRTGLGDLVIEAFLVKRVPLEFVPGIPAESGETTTAVAFAYTTFKETEIDGDRIRNTDRRGLIFPVPGNLALVAATDDVVRVGTDRFRVVFNDKVMAGDTVALSQVHLRPV